MPLITQRAPKTWQDLETAVADILNECGMNAERQVRVKLPRGAANVDVLADEIVEGIRYRTICECKNWRTNVHQHVVHAFRTVMQESGANRGYIISRKGFQKGALEAAHATNVELVTWAQFQEIYFGKWIARRCRDIEATITGFHVYYEPLGRPGYHLLESDAERRAYDEVWHRYLFAGVMLTQFSPYLRMTRDYPYPTLPFDVAELEREGVQIPVEVKEAAGYREFLGLLEHFATIGLQELRAVNPITRGRAEGEFIDEDLPLKAG